MCVRGASYYFLRCYVFVPATEAWRGPYAQIGHIAGVKALIIVSRTIETEIAEKLVLFQHFLFYFSLKLFAVLQHFEGVCRPLRASPVDF